MNEKSPIILRLNPTQRILILRRLALYLRAGISLPRALGYIGEDTREASLIFILRKIETVIQSGAPLSQAFGRFPKQFDLFTVGFVAAGEAGGALPETLDRLADIFDKRQSLRRKIVAALVYPSIVMVGTFGMAAFLTLFIFPKILPVLQGFHTKLPFTTRTLIVIDVLFAKHGLIIATAIILAIILFATSLRYQFFVRRYEWCFIHIPLLGFLYKDYALSTALHVLSLLLHGGVRIIPALTLIRSVAPGFHYREALEQVEERVANGQRLSVSLSEHQNLFPPLVSQLVAVGEATGTLQENLATLARLYEENLDDITRNLTVLIEPILMMVMGLMVGFVALAIITPIYQVTQSINIQS